MEVTEIRCILKIELTGYRIGLDARRRQRDGVKGDSCVLGGTEWLKKKTLARKEVPGV